MDLGAQWNGAASVLVAMITTYGLRVVGAVVTLVAAKDDIGAAIARLKELTDSGYARAAKVEFGRCAPVPVERRAG
ncbi:MAG: hypothetical protein HYZ40_03020 [Rhodospirillales bacterium]|nr:hypothetical protein [Rhodospirillales bacterium]